MSSRILSGPLLLTAFAALSLLETSSAYLTFSSSRFSIGNDFPGDTAKTKINPIVEQIREMATNHPKVLDPILVSFVVSERLVMPPIMVTITKGTATNFNKLMKIDPNGFTQLVVN
jgi:hypothetical protein